MQFHSHYHLKRQIRDIQWAALKWYEVNVALAQKVAMQFNDIINMREIGNFSASSSSSIVSSFSSVSRLLSCHSRNQFDFFFTANGGDHKNILLWKLIMRTREGGPIDKKSLRDYNGTTRNSIFDSKNRCRFDAMASDKVSPRFVFMH